MKNFLSHKEKIDLKIQHKLEKNGRVRDRIKAVLLSNNGWNYVKIAEVLLLDNETVSKHVNEYKKDHKLHMKNNGSFSKLNIKQSEKLIKHLALKTYVKVEDICAYVLFYYKISYTISGMTDWLHSHKFSYKKPKGSPAKADLGKQNQWIKYYKKLINCLPSNEPIEFVDGVHPTIATKISYGWIRTGSDNLISTTGSRIRMNILGSINLKTMNITISSDERLNSKTMCNHFTLLRKKYLTSARIHLVLDQGSYNKSIETKKAANKYNIILHYLPPYSPNLNPIERLWKIMNEFCRNNRYFNQAKEFRETIINFFTITWPKIADAMRKIINDKFQTIKLTI